MSSEYARTQARQWRRQKEKEKAERTELVHALKGNPLHVKLAKSDACSLMCEVGKPLWQPERSIPKVKETVEEKRGKEKRAAAEREAKRRAGRKRRV